MAAVEVQLYDCFHPLLAQAKRRCERLHHFPRTVERRSGSFYSTLAKSATLQRLVRTLTGGDNLTWFRSMLLIATVIPFSVPTGPFPA